MIYNVVVKRSDDGTERTHTTAYLQADSIELAIEAALLAFEQKFPGVKPNYIEVGEDLSVGF